jgi:hypothetical protein
MIFTVVWLPAAKGQLADLWVNGPDRQAVADASNAIDRLLRIDAHLRGLPFFERRILAVAPLAVIFDVSQDDRLATVADVKRVS